MGRFKLEITTGNAAMSGAAAIGGALADVAADMGERELMALVGNGESIRDDNGNTVGRYFYEADGNEEVNSGEYEISLEELEAMPTLIEGQADDCKIDTGTERVWLSRCTTLDGEPWDNKVTVEHLTDGRWVAVEWWEAV